MLAIVQVGAVALFLLLGFVRPRSPGPLVQRELMLNVATGAALFLVRLTAVSWLAARAEVGVVDLSALPSGAALVVCFLALDLGRYAVHRLDHRLPFLWAFHRVHHSSERLDATSGLRMHAVDFLQLSLLPILLFAVVLDTSAVPPWVVPSVLAVGMVSDAYQHANVRIDLRHPFHRRWNQVLNNPHFHSWHHVRDRALADGNYGQTLVVWDRLFGTAVDRAESPPAFGLERDDALVPTLLGLQALQRPPRAGLAATES